MAPGRIALAFIAGVLVLAAWPQALLWLPPAAWPWWLLAALAVGLLLLAASPPVRTRSHWRWALLAAGAFLTGFAWHGGQLQAQQQARLDVAWDPPVDVALIARVAEFPQQAGRVTRLQLVVEQVTPPVLTPGARLRLNLYAPRAEDAQAAGAPLPQPALGERWQLQGRLRPPEGMVNFVGFDYAGWLFRQRIAATGSVRQPATAVRLAPASGLAALRGRLAAGIDRAVADPAAAAMLRAVVVGDRTGLAPLRPTLQATGTSHLMAISGLHIGLVAVAAGALASLLLTLAGWPAVRASAVSAWVAALGYALLAGMGLPVQRALIMLGVVTLALLWQRPLRRWQPWLVALALILARDPLASADAGLWLSFGAVACLIYGFAGRPLRADGAAAVALRSQWQIVLGLAPLLLWWFGRLSLLAPLVNLALVPLFAFWIVPVALVGGVLAALGLPGAGLVWQAAAAPLSGLWPVLVRLAQSGLAELVVQPPSWALPLAALGLCWLLAPRGWPLRPLGLLLAALALALPPARPPAGVAEVVVLDVGQGLAVAMRTRRHVLVFDTGVDFASGSSAAELALVPQLRAWGVRHIDLLIVSHEDADHRGGVPALRAALPVREALMGGSAAARLAGFTRCRSGTRWQWDGVDIRLLHPQDEATGGNDGSCVLRIDTRAGSLLLTGDIEAAGERTLLREDALRPADVLVVAHHGSDSSSTWPLLRAVAPCLAIVPAGAGNRWGFPAPAVRARFSAVGAALAVTGQDGAIAVHLGSAPTRVMAAGARRLPWSRPASQWLRLRGRDDGVSCRRIAPAAPERGRTM